MYLYDKMLTVKQKRRCLNVYDAINTWIAPLIVTVIGGLIVFYLTHNKNYNQQQEKQSYLYGLLDSIDNNFQICLDIYIYNTDKISENLNTLDNIITSIYKISTEHPPLINVDNDRYSITEIIQSARKLNSTLTEIKNTFDQTTKQKSKIELLNKLRNSFLLFCYNNKPIINDMLKK